MCEAGDDVRESVAGVREGDGPEEFHELEPMPDHRASFFCCSSCARCWALFCASARLRFDCDLVEEGANRDAKASDVSGPLTPWLDDLAVGAGDMDGDA